MTTQLKIAGFEHYMDAIMKVLAYKNEDFSMSNTELKESYYPGDYVYQYDGTTSRADLIPEPDNPHDANAIKIMVDGQLMGYVPQKSCSKVKKLMNNPKYQYCSVGLLGGKYKHIWEDDNEKINIEKGEKPYTVQLFIYMEGDD